MCVCVNVYLFFLFVFGKMIDHVMHHYGMLGFEDGFSVVTEINPDVGAPLTFRFYFWWISSVKHYTLDHLLNMSNFQMISFKLIRPVMKQHLLMTSRIQLLSCLQKHGMNM